MMPSQLRNRSGNAEVLWLVVYYAILAGVVDMIAAPQWERLVVEDLRGTVMVVGASDTGKSTLARYLYQTLCRRGSRVAYLDADLGQSTLGLPSTLNLGLASEAGDDRFPPQGPGLSYFVGSTTPRGHMLPTVIGAYRLQQMALALAADAVIVDTTGLVDSAQGGKALKQWKIELLAPGMVIGLQRSRELEPILWPLRHDGRVRSVEIRVSPHVKVRSREARIAWRRERLARYFAGTKSRLVNLRQIAIYDLERLAVGSILGFQDAQSFCLGLGAVEQAEHRQGAIAIRTPLPDMEKVASLRFGVLRWDLANQREL
jgi:polynucleotide 5'-hydroxyl-kinase GRC3/NOL9